MSSRIMWLWQDIRFAFRTIHRDRGFFLAAVLALALGIGSTTAIFSVIYNVLLEPFPYREGQGIFCPEILETGTSRINNAMTMPEFLDFRRENRVFADSMGVTEESVLLKESGRLKEFDADRLTANAFEFLGIPALIGRGLLPRDAEPGAPPVFVLNYRVWKQDFNSDPHVIGKSLNLNGTQTTLVGVMPPRFAFWDGNLWRPLPLDRTDKEHHVVMYGHLRSGITARQAAAEVLPLATRLAKAYPSEFPKRFSVRMGNLIQETIGDFEKTLYTLLGAVGLLLVIACANVSNLLLAKATAREKELALRISLGAGRLRIIRQLLVESVVLALAGAVAGCVLAWSALQGLVVLIPMWTFPDEANITVNMPVLMATIGVAMFTGLLFGMAPAVSALRRDANEALKTGTRGNTGFRRGRMRNLLIVGEVALSLVLLTSSGLLMRSFFLQRQADIGMRSDHLLITHLNLPPGPYKSTESQARFLREVLQKMEADRGVTAVGIGTEQPPYSSLSTDFEILGAMHSEHWNAHMAGCSWQLFRTLGAKLLAGRFLTESDETGKRHVLIINQAMSARYFGRRNPIGQRLQLTALKTAAEPVANPWFEIVGVVANIKNEGTRKDVSPEAYIPYTIEGFGAYTLFLRTVREPESMIAGLTTVVLTLDGTVIPQMTWSMDRLLELSEYSRPRFGMMLLAAFAGVGLVLVSVGVYSVISYSVSQQRHEIGIRMSLGATAGTIRTHVITASLRFVYVGAAIGIVITLLLSRVIASQVWGVAWYDPVTLGAVLVLLTCVGIVAAYVPSVRASRVDPAICLRSE